MDYRIQRGDTLTALAKKFNTTVEKLAQANNIADPDRIYAGASLKVPDGFDTERPPEAPNGLDRPVDPDRRTPTPTGPAVDGNGRTHPPPATARRCSGRATLSGATARWARALRWVSPAAR